MYNIHQSFFTLYAIVTRSRDYLTHPSLPSPSPSPTTPLHSITLNLPPTLYKPPQTPHPNQAKRIIHQPLTTHSRHSHPSPCPAPAPPWPPPAPSSPAPAPQSAAPPPCTRRTARSASSPPSSAPRAPCHRPRRPVSKPRPSSSACW